MLVGLTLRDENNKTRALDFKVGSSVEANILLELLKNYTYSMYFSVTLAKTRDELLLEDYSYISEYNENMDFKPWGRYSLVIYKTSVNDPKMDKLGVLITDTKTECDLLYTMLSRSKKYSFEKVVKFK